MAEQAQSADAPVTANRRHGLGVVLVLLSAVMFSLSGVFTKVIESGAWTILVWRGLIGAILIYAYVLWRRRHELGRQSLKLGWRGWVLAGVGSLASIAFIFSFKLTYVANVTIIYAVVPFVAAALEWLLRGEPIRPATMIAAAICLVGIAIMVAGGIGSPSILGDLVAVIMMLLNALYLVLIRVFTKTPAVLAGALAAFQLFVVGWFFADPLAIGRHDAVFLLLFGAAFAAASILWTEGARLIPAAESGLFGSADIPMAIVFAWLLLSELPPNASLIGGAIVLATVFLYAVRDYRRRERP
jgi:drug/metabolite transporter (DMT)-like permease